MSADYYGTLRFRGTPDEYDVLCKLLKCFSEERQQQYKKERNCWYFYLDDLPQYSEDEISISLSGPWGIMRGMLEDCGFFEEIAEVVPNSWFQGIIRGFDPGGSQAMKAELKKGLLYIAGGYYDYRISSKDDDWETIYNPITKEYRRYTKINLNDSIQIFIKITDLDNKEHELILTSHCIAPSINLACFPKDLLAAKDKNKIIQLLTESFSNGDDSQKQEITALGNMIQGEIISKLELTKTFSLETPVFFGWLRSKYVCPELKPLAKKVISCAPKNKQKNLEAFGEYVKKLEIYFPGCDEHESWPHFCGFGHSIPAGKNMWSWNEETKATFDWRGVAGSLTELAAYICSKEYPKEYSVEHVVVDYAQGVIKQTAVYMPDGPNHKPTTEDDIFEEENTTKSVESGSKCEGLTFVVTGKVEQFKNRDELSQYIETQGGKVSGSVSKNTDFLVNNDFASTSSKNTKAKELGVPIITEQEFIEKFGK